MASADDASNDRSCCWTTAVECEVALRLPMSTVGVCKCRSHNDSSVVFACSATEHSTKLFFPAPLDGRSSTSSIEPLLRRARDELHAWRVVEEELHMFLAFVDTSGSVTFYECTLPPRER